MVLSAICTPALIYLVFSVTQISIDTFQGMYNTAFTKVWVSLIFTIVLNYLCSQGLGIISWFIVFIPFTLMTLIISILLYLFGLDPATGRIKISAPPKQFKADVISVERIEKARRHRRRERRRAQEEERIFDTEYGDYYNHRDHHSGDDFARGDDIDREEYYKTSYHYAKEDEIRDLPHWKKKLLKKHYGHDWKKKYEKKEWHRWNKKHKHKDHYEEPTHHHKHHNKHHKHHKKHQPVLYEPFLDNFKWPSWPTVQMPKATVSAPLVSLPKVDLGSFQLPIPTNISFGCFGKCDESDD